MTPGNKFRLQEDWGETYKGGNPSIFACSLDEGVVCSIDGIPDNLSVGQVQFSPSGDELVFVGWSNEPRRLGIVHCYNRPSALYSVPFDKTIFLKSKEKKPDSNGTADKKSSATDESNAKENRSVLLTKLHRSSRSPRFSPNGNKLVYLASDNAITHNSASKLCVMDWASKQERVIVDIPQEDYAMTDSVDKFPGLFTNFLVSNCYLDNQTIALETQWRSRQTLLSIDIESGKFNKVSIPFERTSPSNSIDSTSFLTICSHSLLVGGDGSLTLLDVRVNANDALGSVLIDASSPNMPSNVLFGQKAVDTWTWTPLPASEQYNEQASRIKSEIGWSIGSIPVRKSAFCCLFLSNTAA